MASATSTITEIWNNLQNGLLAIYTQSDPVSTAKYMELYSSVYNFCTKSTVEESINNRNRRTPIANMPPSGAEFVGEDLYGNLKEFLEKHTSRLLEDAQALAGIELLEHYDAVWKAFVFSSNVVNGIFSYLNRHWIKRELDEGKQGVFEVYNLAIYCWQRQLFNHMSEQITGAILKLILDERNGETIKTSLIKSAINSYIEMGINDPVEPGTNATQLSRQSRRRSLGIFKTFFENIFIQKTQEYYAVEAEDFLMKNSVIEYLKKVEIRLKQENDRVDRYLDPSVLESLMKACDDVLIANYVDRFRSEFDSLLENNQVDDLGRMFFLCERVDGALEVLRGIMESHIERKGRMAISNVTSEAMDPKLYVSTILVVHKQFATLVSVAFKNDSGFVQAMDKAFTSFINRNSVTENNKAPSRSPELLARYSDVLLRKSAKNPLEAEIDEALSQVMIVFKYIEDKDVFQKFYSKMLAKRLVHDMSASEDYESLMLQKLKQMCGFEYTSKLQRMYTDTTMSKELSQKFKRHVQDKKIDMHHLDLSVMVLAQGVWPFQLVDTCNIPPVLHSCLNEFTNYYISQHTGRKLMYLHHMSRGEVTCNAFSRKYGFMATTSQMAVLLMYNDADSYTLQHICEQLNLKNDAYIQVLHTMVKIELLTISTGAVTPNTRMDAVVSLNPKFFSKKLKVDLSKAVTRSEVKKEQVDVQKDLDEDRRMVIQAAIVRVMKMRKKFKHHELMSEVIKQLNFRFVPNVKLIKKCVDILIEKEYLRRVDGDRDTYEYIS